MTRITTPFTRESTTLEVVEGVDLTGRRAIVTGASSGIGIETARALAVAGAEVTLAVRDLGAGEATAKEINATTGRDDVRVGYLDLSKRSSVEAFTAEWAGPLHVLVNNAGVMASPRSYTVDGWELQFGTNHMGHFILTTGLRSALAAADGARVVSVSSSGHLRSTVDFEDLQFMVRDYNPWTAYGQSKTANIWLANEIARRWADDGIVANSLMPGAIHTNLQRHVSDSGARPAARPQRPGHRLQDGRAGRVDVGAAGGLAVARRRVRALLRELHRECTQRDGAPYGLCALGLRHRRRRASLGDLAPTARLTSLYLQEI